MSTAIVLNQIDEPFLVRYFESTLEYAGRELAVFPRKGIGGEQVPE